MYGRGEGGVEYTEMVDVLGTYGDGEGGAYPEVAGFSAYGLGYTGGVYRGVAGVLGT